MFNQKSRALHALIGNSQTLSFNIQKAVDAQSFYFYQITIVGASSLLDNFLHCLLENANTPR